jgi:transposase
MASSTAATVGKNLYEQVMDTLGSADFLAAHPKVRFHFTPTYSSWLNQVELWLAKIQRDLLARRHLHFRRRLGPHDSQVHPGLYQTRQALPLVLFRSQQANHC